MLTVLDLFSGIGGFSFGLESTGGFKTVQFCEIEPYARKVLAKHWPKVPCHDDVRTLNPDFRPDVICGGFPCQDISNAGPKLGLDGERSGLWREYARLIRALRPQYVIVENVAALLNRGIGRVLGDLAACGYDAEWDCITASSVGAPHLRDRIYILAYPASARRERWWTHKAEAGPWPRGNRQQPQGLCASRVRISLYPPGAIGVANGFPDRVDRLHGLGNSVVPQIVAGIGKAILNSI